MKKAILLITVIMLLIGLQAIAQSPEKIKYQAIARDNAGNVIANQLISFRVSILQGSSTGTSVYTETHQATTNDFGLANLNIGNGSIVSGDFTSIAWSADLHFLKVEMDPAGGSAFQLMGTSQLLSVPYALHAKTADSIIGNNSNSWGIIGNAGTDPATNFIGTTDNQPLIFKVNNVQAGKISSELLNSFYGLEAGVNTTGVGNTGTGFQTLYNNTIGIHNTASGNSALHENISGQHNTAIGVIAMYSNISGFRNTAIGSGSLYANTEGSYNTATGYNSLRDNTSGENNTTSGAYSLFNNTTGNYNTAYGSNALYSIVTGNENTATGYQALYHNTQSKNTANGYQALYSNTIGVVNTASGYQALYSNTTGNHNTATGNKALYGNTSAHWNTANGSAALQSNTTGDMNTAIGFTALYNNTIGSENTATGRTALFSNTSGDFNTANGKSALYYNTTGYENTAIGYKALVNNTEGYRNTANGSDALYSNTSGNWNTAIGCQALEDNKFGTLRTGLGGSANSTGESYSNNTGLGNNADCTASDQVRIGDFSVSSIGGYANWSNVSDKRFKANIKENVEGLSFIEKLRPVTYNIDLHAIDDFFAEHYNERDSSNYEGKYDKEQIRYTGFIAQEVEEAARELGYDFSGVDAPKNEDDFYGLRYAEFVVPLVKALQEQQEIIEQQNINIEKLLKRVEQLEKQ